MENQKLQQAIQKYNSKNDYEIWWELAFSSLFDIEEVVQQGWPLINDPPNLPIPFIALACRLCLETSNNLQRLYKSLAFPGVCSGYADDANLRAVPQRFNLSLGSP